MSKNKPSVAERAVRGVLGGWVYGRVEVENIVVRQDGGAYGCVWVSIDPKAICKMLADEKREKARKKRSVKVQKVDNH